LIAFRYLDEILFAGVAWLLALDVDEVSPVRV
jgi:hypothetical protein